MTDTDQKQLAPLWSIADQLRGATSVDDFNLNISCYTSTAVGEDEIDLKAPH